MPRHTGLESFRVYTCQSTHVIHVPLDHGPAFQAFLRSHEVEAAVCPAPPMRYDRIEVQRDISAGDLQAIIDQRPR
jgi:hypothetical protein